MFWIALRSQAWAILGWGGFLSLFATLMAASYGRIAATSSGDAATLAQALANVGRQAGLLLPLPERLDTLGGFLQWFLFGYFPLFLGIWAIIAGTGVARGAEERGLVEQWLSTGLRRWRLLGEQIAAFAVALVLACLLVELVTEAAARLSGAGEIPLGSLFLKGLAAVPPCLFVFTLGLLTSSLVATRRNALGLAAVGFGALFVLNGLGRVTDWAKPLRWLSPFYAYDRSDPLVPGGHFDLLSALVVLAATAALAALAAWAFANRDLGATIIRRRSERGPQRLPTRNPLLALPALQAVWEQRVGLAVWSAAIGAYAFFYMSTVRPFVGMFSSGDRFMSLQARVAFGFGPRDAVAAFVGTSWFGAAGVLLAAFAVTQVSRWASEDSEGRLEMLLSAGVPRWRVVLERPLSLLLAAAVILAFMSATIWAGSRAYDLHLSTRGLVLASLMILPVTLAFGAAGSALAAFRPRVAVVALAAVLLVSYMIPYSAAPIFAPDQPPDWFLRLSVFKLYGIPLTDGVDRGGLYTLVAISALGLAVTLVAMQRREVGR
ncbi:MAG TPA: ABC transporter permease subunit [Candidatus Acidoferrales bacterium]|nr:ABC transporter permease subunit [Candidatus Acidoferrales bacterium]